MFLCNGEKEAYLVRVPVFKNIWNWVRKNSFITKIFLVQHNWLGHVQGLIDLL